jgi:hypothetical protein
MKCQFGHRKMRYRGIARNGAQVFSLLEFANPSRPQNACGRMTALGAERRCPASAHSTVTVIQPQKKIPRSEVLSL